MFYLRWIFLTVLSGPIHLVLKNFWTTSGVTPCQALSENCNHNLINSAITFVIALYLRHSLSFSFLSVSPDWNAPLTAGLITWSQARTNHCFHVKVIDSLSLQSMYYERCFRIINLSWSATRKKEVLKNGLEAFSVMEDLDSHFKKAKAPWLKGFALWNSLNWCTATVFW